MKISPNLLRPIDPFTSRSPFNRSPTKDGYVWYWNYCIAAKLEPEYALNKLSVLEELPTVPFNQVESFVINEVRVVEGHPTIASLYSGLNKCVMFVDARLLAYLLKTFKPEFYTYLSGGGILAIEQTKGGLPYAYLAKVVGHGL